MTERQPVRYSSKSLLSAKGVASQNARLLENETSENIGKCRIAMEGVNGTVFQR